MNVLIPLIVPLGIAAHALMHQNLFFEIAVYSKELRHSNFEFEETP